MEQIIKDLRQDLKLEIRTVKTQALLDVDNLHMKEFWGGKLDAFNYVLKYLDKWEKENGK
jgi:hypothetical protein